MKFVKENWPGILACLAIAVPSWFLGKAFPIIGGAVIAIVAGMLITLLIKNKSGLEKGIKFTSKKILQWAVVLLGFGMDLGVVLHTGKQSLPIIVCTITVSLATAYVLHRAMRIPMKVSTLVGVGSSICGGSAVAATAPVIDADEEEVAQSISVIFFFNVLAALIFPALGQAVGFSTASGEAFGIFAGTAVNDTSSVTAAAATWDGMWNLGSATLDKAVTVKLTRTLAIIPITLAIAFFRARSEKERAGGVSVKHVFPFFILFFVAASVITTFSVSAGIPQAAFAPFKELSKFFIIMAMAAIGLGTDMIKLLKSGGKPILLGAACWIGITLTSLALQSALGLM